MNTDEIMKALAFDGTSVPEAAIEAAASKKAEMIPAFVGAIDALCAIRKPGKAQLAASPLFVAVLLLGEWRAKEAYPAFCRLMGRGETVMDGLFGDAIENCAAIAVRLYDGDPKPIFDLILNPHADQFVRSKMFDALVRLAVDEAIQRTVVEDFVRSAHAALEPRRDNMVWAGWVEAVAVLGLDDFAPQAREAILSGRVPPDLMATKHFDADLAHAKAHPENPWPEDLGFEELEPASVVLQGFLRDEDDGHGGGVDPFAPLVNPLRDIGRNDPCPCGSGKKFKKCCLGAAP